MVIPGFIPPNWISSFDDEAFMNFVSSNVKTSRRCLAWIETTVDFGLTRSIGPCQIPRSSQPIKCATANKGPLIVLMIEFTSAVALEKTCS